MEFLDTFLEREKLKQQLERIRRLPRAKQRFVLEMLDTVLTSG